MLPVARIVPGRRPQWPASGANGALRCETTADGVAKMGLMGLVELPGVRRGVSFSTSERTADSSALPGTGRVHRSGSGPVCTSGGR